MIQLGSFHTDLMNSVQLGSPLPKRSRLSLKRSKLFPSQSSTEELENHASMSFDSSYTTECLDSTMCVPAVSEDQVMDTDEVPTVEDNSPTDLETLPLSSLLGLPNCGNTCFINSVLQVLRYTPNFLSSLHQLIEAGRQCGKGACTESELKEITFFDHLHDLYVAMKRQEKILTNKRRDSYSVQKHLKTVIINLREISCLFEEGEQHDAHEFLLTVISTFSSSCQTVKKVLNVEKLKCQRELLCQEITDSIMEELAESIRQVPKRKHILTKKKKTGRASKPSHIQTSMFNVIMDELELGFQGKRRSIVKCLECESRRSSEDVFTDLGFPFVEDSVSDDDSIDAEQSVKGVEDTVDLWNCLAQHCHCIMRDENKVYCEECCRLNETKMSSEVIFAPSVLLLHLIHSSTSSIFEKTFMKVIIPLSFETSENAEIFNCNEDCSYSLYAVVVHIGQSTEAGHYVSFIRDGSNCTETVNNSQPTMNLDHCCASVNLLNRNAACLSNKWLLYDDETVSLVCLEENIDTFPYFNYLGVTASPKMIFYCKS